MNSTVPIYHYRKYYLECSEKVLKKITKFYKEQGTGVWESKASGLWAYFLKPLNEEAKDCIFKAKHFCAQKGIRPPSAIAETEVYELTDDECVNLREQIMEIAREQLGWEIETIKFSLNNDGSYDIYVDYGGCIHDEGDAIHNLQAVCCAVAIVTRKMKQKTRYLIVDNMVGQRLEQETSSGKSGLYMINMSNIRRERWKVLTSDCRKVFPANGNWDFYKVGNILKNYCTREVDTTGTGFEPAEIKK